MQEFKQATSYLQKRGLPSPLSTDNGKNGCSFCNFSNLVIYSIHSKSVFCLFTQILGNHSGSKPQWVRITWFKYNSTMLADFDSSSSKCYSIKLFSLISICRKNWSNTSAIHFTMNSPFLYSFKLVYFDFVQQWFFSYYLSYYMSMKKLTATEIDSMLSLLFIVPLSFRWKEYVSHIFDTQQYIIFT